MPSFNFVLSKKFFCKNEVTESAVTVTDGHNTHFKSVRAF